MTARRASTVVRVLRTAALLYALLCLAALVFDDWLIFRPHASSYRDSNDILKLTTRDGTRISAACLPNPRARYTLLYSHGNGEDLGDDRTEVEAMRQAGFAVFAYDYHGYGTSAGRPSEDAAYQDIEAAYAYLTGPLKVPPGRIIVYGRSLGGGPATYLASREPVAGLILESSFTAAFRAVTVVPLLPFDRFPNLARIRRVRCPVLVMHGTADTVIPFHHGRALYRAAPRPKRRLWVSGAGHDNLREVAGERYARALRELAALVEQKQNAARRADGWGEEEGAR